MLDARRLKVLCEVARRGSFSAAAAALGYTQPAVSRQIAVLEAEIGTPLLRRSPQGVVLTDAGRVLAHRAEDVLARLDRIEDEVRLGAGLEGGSLRLAVFASAAASIFPAAIVQYRERHPGVELSVLVADPVDALPQLRSGELDMVLCHDGGEIGPADPALESPSAPPPGTDIVPLLEDPVYVALPADHPLAHTPALTLAALASETWMLPSLHACLDGRRIVRACHEAGFEPIVAFQYDDYAALLGFVAAGVGVAPIPDTVARGARADVVLRTPLPPLPSRPIVAALPSGYRSPAAAAMVSVLQNVCLEWAAAPDALAAARGERHRSPG
jgi:DNA-binding transcriptional LysR family regulator